LGTAPIAARSQPYVNRRLAGVGSANGNLRTWSTGLSRAPGTYALGRTSTAMRKEKRDAIAP
jgi:hypothetical protein